MQRPNHHQGTVFCADELDSCEANCFVNQCKNIIATGPQQYTLRGQQGERNGEEFISNSELFGKLPHALFVLRSFCWIYPQIADALAIYRTTGLPACVILFACSECVSRIVCYIEYYLYSTAIGLQMAVASEVFFKIKLNICWIL